MGKFKNLFFNSDENQEKENVKKEEVIENKPSNAVVQPIEQNNVNVTTTGVVEQNVYNVLNEVLEGFNIPGPDYLEVKKAYESLKSVILDDNSRFVAAYGTIKATSPSLNKKVMIESIKTYIEKMEIEYETSNEEFKIKMDSEVGVRQKNIDDKNIEISENNKKIVELQEKNKQLNTEIGVLFGEMTNKKYELENQKRNFDTTFQSFISNLKSDSIKIETLINE